MTPSITLSISNPAPFPKPDSGQLMGMFVVTRSGDLPPTVQVDYATQDGTGANGAHAGTDYLATSGTLHFASNQTTATITVSVLGNNVFQVNKTFTVRLSNPQSNSFGLAPQRTFATGNQPYSVAVGDFNGDGKPDLVVANQLDDAVSVLLNTTPAGASTPSFAPQRAVATGGLPISVAVGDFNGDGKPDLAVANSLDDTVSVLLNTTPTGATAPSFAPQRTVAVGNGPIAVGVGDFNHDGKPDLAVVNQFDDTVSVLLNTTPARATVPSFAPQRTFATGSNPFAVAVGDFNGDGKLDLAVANSGANTVSVLLNTTPVGATTPSFASQQSFATGNFPVAVAVGDFNGDGKPDLAVANQDSTSVSVLLNTTPAGATVPSFAPQRTFATGNDPVAVAVGDFNGDGQPDLGVANLNANTVSVLVNTTPTRATTPSFASQQTFATGHYPAAVAVGDFNGDGHPDLAAANQFDNNVSVLLNSPTPITLSGNPATGTISSANQAPATIAVVAGTTPQSTVVATVFAVPLAVDVRDAAGTLVQGVSVTFTAPGSGPSGQFGTSTTVTIVTNASGRATAPTFTANTTAGSYTVTAQAAGGSNPATSFNLTNTAAAADHFRVTTAAANPDVAGTPFDVTVTVQDAYGNTVPDYVGTVTFSSGDPYGATLPDDYTFQPSDQGVATFPGGATLYTAGTQDVTATDTTSGITGAALVTVVAAAPDHFAIATTADDPDVAGTPFDVTVTVQDAYGNTVTGYTGTVTFSSGDPYGATLPDDYTFQPSDQGMATFSGGATLYTAGAQDVTATDTTSGITGSAFVNVRAAPAVAFQVIAPANAASGTPFDVTLIAVDPYGNTDTNYQGTVTWTTSDSDPGVVLPDDYTFQASDQGMVTFPGGVTLITPGDQTITATDTDSGITGSATVAVDSPGSGSGPSAAKSNPKLGEIILERKALPAMGVLTSKAGGTRRFEERSQHLTMRSVESFFAATPGEGQRYSRPGHARGRPALPERLLAEEGTERFWTLFSLYS